LTVHIQLGCLSDENIMSRFPQIISAVIIFAFGVVSCRTAPTQPSTEISQPVTQPSIVPSPFPSPLPPTLSPNEIVTLEITQEIIAPSPTPFLLKTKFSKACQDEYYENHTKISPNGGLLAESCFTNGTMQVSNQDGTKMFVVDGKDYFSDPLFPELTGSVESVHWTKDSRFIYFTVTPEQWNEGAYHLDSFAPLLCRLDIDSSEISEVLSGAFYHSFSPTDRRLIEVQEFEHPIKLIVHDLQTGLSQKLIPDNNSKYGQAVRVVWSPDGLKFVFVAAFGGEYGDEMNEPNVQSLILVDVEDLSQHLIISEIPDFIEPVSWDENDVIVYQIMNYEDRYQTITYTYDYQKEEITVLPTIAP
jgi:hypothetical protein